jgi:hypothetical protein
MSNYPLGAFEKLCEMHDQEAKNDARFEAAKPLRIAEIREGGVIEYTAWPRKDKTSAVELVDENLDPEIMRQAITAHLAGKIAESATLFALACEVAIDRAADFLATCDVEQPHD